MLKKSFYQLLSFCFFSAISAISGYAVGETAYTDSSLFDPETSDCSKKTTIKTWLAPQNYPHLDTIQANVALTVQENPFSVHFSCQIVNSPGVTQYFGKTFHTMPFELEFLRYVRHISTTKTPVTLELAAAIGMVSWKVPLCFGEKRGAHYVNELSPEMDKSLESTIKHQLKETPELKETLVKLPGSCFDIPQTHPALLGTVDAIYVQNLDHFFNPADHQRYMGLLKDLLAPGGRAFLCAHSFSFKKNDPLYQLYLKQKKEGDFYPGFATHDVEFSQSVKYSFEVGEYTLSNAVRPSDQAPFQKFDLQPSQDATPVYYPQMGKIDVKKCYQRTTINAFSPAIYTKLVGRIPEIKLVDTFFITKDGQRAATWDSEVSHAAVIFEKK